MTSERKHTTLRACPAWQKVTLALAAVLLALLAAPWPTRTQTPAREQVELGQTVEGAGSANFSWLRMPGMQCAVAFRAPRTGQVQEITLQWKTNNGYGGGRLGIYRFELRANGADNYPAPATLAVARGIRPEQAMDGRPDGAFRVPLRAALREGETYHLVISNTDAQPERNWSSPNTLMTRVAPWDGSDYRVAFNGDGVWQPWSSQNNPFNTSKRNEVSGARCPLMLRWEDGAVTGDPYYSAAYTRGAYLYGAHCAGQFITWDRPTATITRIGVSVWKRGTPGDLYYHLEAVTGGELASGVIATAASIGEIATWVYAELPAGVELRQGQRYRLWFNSPASPDAQHCYVQYVPYGDKRPAAWLEAGWGGTASHYIAGDGVTWTGQENADFTFSLQ